MLKSLPRLEDISRYGSVVESVRDGRGIVFIPGSDPACRELEEGKVQKPVYYTSRALRGAEGRYSLIEKLAFTLITAFRKLRHYFQAHVINVMTDHPLKKAMNKLEASARLIQSQIIEFHGCFLRIQPNKDGRGRPGEDILCYQSRLILL